MKKYEYILFDADGTLFDFKKCESEALRLATSRLNIQIDDKGVRLYSDINDSLWKALERGEIEKEALKVKRFELFGQQYGFECDFSLLAKTYADELALQSFMIDGAIDICGYLFKKYKLFIITNGIEYVQKKRFALSPLLEFFQQLFISGEIGFEKPSIKFFEAVEKGINGFDKNKALVVGDSLTSDMAGGISAGIDCCFYNPERKTIPENMKNSIKYDIATLSDLREFL